MATTIENVRGKSSHIKYKLADGTPVPGVSTIKDLLGPVGGLGYWGFMVGKSGEVDNYWGYMAGLASAGTACHVVIEAHLKGETLDVTDFTGKELAIAYTALEKFKKWAEGKTIRLIYSEKPLVSEEHRYGGTLDLYCEVDGLFTVIDIKSSKEPRLEMLVQAASYRTLVEESGDPVDQIMVIALGRDAADPIKVRIVKDTTPLWEVFTHLMNIHRVYKQAEKAA